MVTGWNLGWQAHGERQCKLEVGPICECTLGDSVQCGECRLEVQTFLFNY